VEFIGYIVFAFIMDLLTLNKRTDKTRLQLSNLLEFVNVLMKSLCCASVRPSASLCGVQSHSCELVGQQTDSNEILHKSNASGRHPTL